MEKIVRPPGPENRGIVGNFPLAGKDPLGTYLDWARRYGPVFYYRAFNRHVYFLNDPELIKSVLLTNYQNFTKGEVLQVSRSVFGNGLLTSEGEAWLRQRRLIQPAFHKDKINSYGEIMVARTEDMIATWKEGQARDIHQDMMGLALEIVTGALFRTDLAQHKSPFGRALNTILELSAGARMLLPPLLRAIPTPGNLRYWRAVRQLDEIVFELIRKERSANGSRGGLISALLGARDEDGRPMTDTQLRDEVITMLLAGHETTAVSLSWIWYLLAQYPAVEAKLWEELDQVLAGRPPVAADLPRLVWTECIVKEGMRLYPPVWAVVRSPIRDCEIGGYHVTARSNIVMSQWVVHHDPQLYPEPDAFRPERWLGEAAKALPKFAWFPFGGGPRSCIGSGFAMLEAALVLATVAQRYQLRLASDRPVQPTPTITLRPRGGVQVTPIRRVPDHQA